MSLLLFSCKDDIKQVDDVLSQSTGNSLKSIAKPEIPVGVPTESPFVSVQYNGVYYYCDWAGIMRINNPYNPTNYTGMILKKVIVDSQSWDVVVVSCSSAYYPNPSWGEVSVNNENFAVTLSYCSKKSESGSCTEWKSVVQRKTLVKVLNPHGALSNQFALVSGVYLQNNVGLEE